MCGVILFPCIKNFFALGLRKIWRMIILVHDFDGLEKKYFDWFNNIKSLNELEEIRIKLFGKNGEIKNLMREIKNILPEKRKDFGEQVNNLKTNLESELKKTEKKLFDIAQDLKLEKEKIDITLPGRFEKMGKLHVLSLIENEIENIFISMGYEVIPAFSIEHIDYNFTKLNISEKHPARDEQDTFYIDSEHVLVTATSPMQIRIMDNKKPPIKIISPGTVYRSDEIDATHTPMFNQIEGLVVDKNISMSDLRGTLDWFAKKLFGKETKTRFRPHYFPFTEPSAEMDVTCFICGGSGCKTCKNTGFIELLGCGMVHPKVLRNVEINPDEFSGFAFGMGLERIAMQCFGINDIRLFYENDLRFLEQF